MTQEDIIRMAREAGLKVGANISGVVLVGSPAEIGLAHLTIDELERFAALVAAAERHECAKIVDGNADGCNGMTEQILRSNAASIRAREEQA